MYPDNRRRQIALANALKSLPFKIKQKFVRGIVRSELSMSTAVEQHEIKEAACPECGVVLQGRYCHACGEQRPDREDLQLKHFLHHAVHELTHLDPKIFRTLKALVVR